MAMVRRVSIPLVVAAKQVVLMACKIFLDADGSRAGSLRACFWLEYCLH